VIKLSSSLTLHQVAYMIIGIPEQWSFEKQIKDAVNVSVCRDVMQSVHTTNFVVCSLQRVYKQVLCVSIHVICLCNVVLYRHFFSTLLWNMPLGGFRQTRRALD
jgi:hypothetical protein